MGYRKRSVVSDYSKGGLKLDCLVGAPGSWVRMNGFKEATYGFESTRLRCIRVCRKSRVEKQKAKATTTYNMAPF